MPPRGLREGREDETTKESMAPQEPEEEGECTGAVKRRKAAAATAVSMELDILDCPVCYHPLRPPIFQCAVGHVVCSSCRAKLPDRCHSCSITMVYNRCHIIEHVVDSTKVPCIYCNLGCTEKITYYEKEDHAKVCPHAPCFCPEASAHSMDQPWSSVSISLPNTSGMAPKFPTTRHFDSASHRAQLSSWVKTGTCSLVNMIHVEAVGGVISVFSIQPHISKSNFKCKLAVSCPEMNYTQCTQFQTRSSNLLGGLPKDCFTFVVPKLLLRDTSTNVTASVSVTLIPP